MTILGIRRVQFKGNDGSEISGYNFWCGENIDARYGEGMSVDKVFLTDYRLSQQGGTVGLGDEVVVSYNKFGKATAITPVKL